MAREYIVELPTHSVGVLEWGPADGEPLIALHGFPDTAWTWRKVAPLLAEQGYRVAAPFLRGYAPSGMPGDYSVRALAADAVALHERLGGTALIGHDWGAIIATTLAGDPANPYPRVAALAVPPLGLMNPTRATLRPWLGAMLRQPRKSWYIAYHQLPGRSERHFERLVRRLWNDWSPGYDATEDIDHLTRAIPDRAHASAAIGYYRERDFRPAFAAPRTPLLYLHGARDGALDRRYFAVAAPHLTPPSRAALIPDAGHFLHLERPEAVAGLLVDWLRTSPHESGM
ncbi:alpha/beta fold hydrolase [Cryptosporangium arvum]|uniref:Putative hydrolase or acyltransferase of alpha/beta superfamily n=1 Tax=Cryptosporangium arvum DSM 44712 TaxID=927661 RepID=A0A010Z6P1_9ACTN|nr:alpha/beta hydrolase [Cryptosporangium arvum]EXG82978.1 putative hydrolase or acyltransferase of alpha/beta superfamily [Cryptosporangium arvum DSM 44712]